MVELSYTKSLVKPRENNKTLSKCDMSYIRYEIVGGWDLGWVPWQSSMTNVASTRFCGDPL